MAGPTKGRLEGRITVPTGGWTATVGAGTATIAAGTYYATTLLTAVGTAFATAASTTCTATASLGESGTGLVTITFGSSKLITWISTDLRDILGFTGNLAAATSHVSTQHMRGAWLPSCAYKAPNNIGSWRGWRESDFRAAENAAGHVWAHVGQHKEVTELSWHAIARSRTWIANESTVNESWERFSLDCLWNNAGWGTPGGPLRFYPDAADSAAYVVYRCPEMSQIRPAPLHDGWAGGPWTISLPRLVADPTDTSGAPRESMVPVELTTGSDSTDGVTFETASITYPANTPVYIGLTGARMSSAVGQNPTSIVGSGGLAFTMVEDNMFNEVTQARDLSLWRAISATAGSGTNLITYANNHSACAWIAVSVPGANTTGSNGSGSVRQVKTGVGNTPISATLDDAIEHPNNITLALLGSNSNSVFTAASGFTMINQKFETLASCAIGMQWKQNATTSSATVPSGAHDLGIILAEIKAAVS